MSNIMRVKKESIEKRENIRFTWLGLHPHKEGCGDYIFTIISTHIVTMNPK